MQINLPYKSNSDIGKLRAFRGAGKPAPEGAETPCGVIISVKHGGCQELPGQIRHRDN